MKTLCGWSKDGLLRNAQQQPPGEVPPARRCNSGKTEHVSGRATYDQSETLAKQGLLPGMDEINTLTAVYVFLSVCFVSVSLPSGMDWSFLFHISDKSIAIFTM